MIIEFDGYGINEYVIGQYISITKLQRMYLNVKHEEISNDGFIDFFVFDIIMNVFPILFIKTL